MDTIDNYHLGNLFIDLMRRRPDSVYHIDASTGEKETNASVLSRSIKLARCIRRLGLKPGDVLALSGKNHLDIRIPYFAALLNGLPVVGIDHTFKYDEIKNLLSISEPKIAFCQQEDYKLYEQVVKELSLNTVLVAFGGIDNSMSKFIERYDDHESEERFRPAIFDTDKVYAWLVPTSGTTGSPKLAAFKHGPWVTKTITYLRNYKSPDDQDNAMGLNLSPVQWISGYFNALSYPALNYCSVQTSGPNTADHIIDIINKYKPKMSLFSPSMVVSILKSEKPCDLSCFNLITITGGKLYNATLKELKSRLNKNAMVVEAYGATETMGPVLRPHPDGPIECCGRPMPGCQVKLMDPETGKEITQPNVVGEIWMKGTTFEAYYNNPEETAKAFSEDGWFKIGDLLYRDEDDNYFYVDRLKTLIKYRNYHIIPSELESVIRDLEGVMEVCVTCVPDPDDGEHPVACVVRKPGSHVTAQEIKGIVADKLSENKQLRGGVIFMDEIPKTSIGKVPQMKLRKLVLNKQRE